MTSRPPPSGLAFRRAEPSDAGTLGTLWARAFPGERTASDRARTLRDGSDAYGGLETCWIAEFGDRPAGAFRGYRLTTCLFGRAVPALGLGAVAVAPEFRRKGVGRALCVEALRIARERGDLLSILFPFRAGFYQRLGWALAGSFHRYRFAPEDLPLFPGRERVRILEVGDRRPRIPDLYDVLLPHRHGLLERSAKQWKVLDDPDTLVLGVEAPGSESGRSGGVGDGDAPEPRGGNSGATSPLAGAAILHARKGPGGRGAELRVRELHVADAGSYRAILGWLSVQRDQWRRITFDALPGERLEHVLDHPRRPETGDRRGLWFESAALLRGPMVRIVNLEGLARELGVVPGTRIELVDEEVPGNTGSWEAVDETRLERRSTRAGAGALPVSPASDLFVRGELPGFAAARSDFRPVMGIADFHLLDSF